MTSRDFRGQDGNNGRRLQIIVGLPAVNWQFIPAECTPYKYRFSTIEQIPNYQLLLFAHLILKENFSLELLFTLWVMLRW